MSSSENLTIMFTDIADYSQTVANMSRKESEAMLKAHDRILHKVLKQYKGKWIKSIGDSFLVTFQSPTDAALCGMAMHDALWEQSNPDEDEGINIRIRVALNLGEVRLTRNDVFGEAVNIAARLEAITPADNIYLTESVYLSMNKAEVLAVKVGSKKFKGSPEEIVYYKIPRSVSRRVVADESEEDERFFDYPFGGAHLKAQLSGTDTGLEMISSALTGRSLGMRSKVMMGVVVLCLVGLALFFSMRSDVATETIAEQNTGTIVTAPPGDAEPVVEAEPAGGAEPVVEAESAGGAEPVVEAEPLSGAKRTEETVVPSMLKPLGESQPPGENEAPNSFDPLNLTTFEKPSAEAAGIESDDIVIGAVAVKQTSLKNNGIQDDVKKLMDDGDFTGLQSLADEYSKTNPDAPYLHIIKGHLLSRSSDYREAIEAYQKGLEGDPFMASDEVLADMLVVLLDYQPSRTKALLRDNLSNEVMDRLSERTGQRGIQSRYYAVKLLNKSGNTDKIDVVGMNIWDLKELKKCKEKKISVVALRRLKDPRALPALKEAIGGKFMDKVRNTCLRKEAKAAISEIEAQ